MEFPRKVPKTVRPQTLTIVEVVLSLTVFGTSSIIGASLSEPHTSVTALLNVCVCVSVFVWPYTENFN